MVCQKIGEVKNSIKRPTCGDGEAMKSGEEEGEEQHNRRRRRKTADANWSAERR